MNPNTLLIAAASIDAPKLNRYDATARRSNSTEMNSPQPIVAVFMTKAVSGTRTIALKKKVENPSVRPKPGRIEG